MTSVLISLETGVLAKKSGFNLECLISLKHKTDYSIVKEHFPYINFSILQIKDWNKGRLSTSRPPQYLLQKWLREAHSIVVTVSFTGYGDFFML